MKKIQFFAVLFLLIPIGLSSINVKINDLSIFEDTNFPGNENSFINCNPCPLTVVMRDEIEPYDKIIFRVGVGSFTSDVGTSESCIAVDSTNWHLACNHPSDFCRSRGYRDYCPMRGKWCDSYVDCGSGLAGVKGKKVCCYKFNQRESETIEFRYEDIALASFNVIDGSQTKDVNIADYLNQYIQNGACSDECSVSFNFYSSNSAGSWNVEPTPIELVKRSITTTTIQTTTTTLKPIGECSLKTPDPCFEKLLRNIVMTIKDVVSKALNIFNIKL